MTTTRRPAWFWILLGLGGGAALLVAAIIALVLWAYSDTWEWKRMTDTHDLRARTQKMAEEYLSSRRGGAVVIGVIQGSNSFVSGFGQFSESNSAAPNGDTLFEIGSVTKVFTGIALARMAGEGRLGLNDTLEKHLSRVVTLPAELRPVTLLQLATHTAGLPRLPDNLDLSTVDKSNPYAAYARTNLYEYLRTAKLSGVPGKTSDYSNTGVALLGHILELASGKPYAQLVSEMICAPLGMASTAITLTPAQRSSLVPGHNTEGKVVPGWDLAVHAPAGALHSTANDLIQFLQANLAPNHPALGSALKLAQQTHFESWLATLGLGWRIMDFPGLARFHWHNGGTGGYVSFVAFDAMNRTGVVLLSNFGDAMAGDDSLDQMGLELLKLAAKVSWE